jgi:hypothetical protein
MRLSDESTSKVKKRYDRRKKWFDKSIKKGKRVRTDEFGVWRKVPGFPKRTIRVSSEGWVQQWSVQQKKWEQPKKGTSREDHYMHIGMHRMSYGVSILINRAFNGAPPSKKHTTDHKNKRDDGDKRLERQDNRASNLKWLDKSGQRKNQNVVDGPRADDRPIELRHDSWLEGEWKWYKSQGKAAEAIGVSNQSICNWHSGKKRCSTGWHVRWASHSETQDDLPAIGYAPAHDVAEKWIKVDCKTWVSNRGRAYQRYRKSETFRKFTPKPTEGTQGYATITVAGKSNILFHDLVFDAFYPKTRGNRTVDHINQSRSDNRLSNLRPATMSEQACNRRKRTLGDGNRDSRKLRLQYRLVDAPVDTPWNTCLGGSELARRLTKQTGDVYSDACISQASRGMYHGKHRYKDYVFYLQ